MKLFKYIASLGFIASLGSSASAEPAKLKELFASHCLECHGEAKQKGKLRIDTLGWDPSDAENLERWQAIYDQLDLGDMPPEDEPQPSDALRSAALQELSSILEQSAAKSHPTVLRRLNRSQYRNAVRDLLHINVELIDPTRAFPSDEEYEGFDVIGESLVMSDFLLREQLAAARELVTRATYPTKPPEINTLQMWSKEETDLFESLKFHRENQQYYLTLNGHRNPNDTRGALAECSKGVKKAGWYDYELEVESKGRSTTSLADLKTRPDLHHYTGTELHCLEIHLTFGARSERILVDRIDLRDDEKQVIKRRVWLEQGWRLGLSFGNAPFTSTFTYAEHIGFVKPEDATNDEARALRSQMPEIIHKLVTKHNMPRIVVHNGKRTGPHFESYPPKSHLMVNGHPDQEIEDHIHQFAERAFRRPLDKDYLAPYFQLARERHISDAIAAILCSPDFLFFKEPEGTLDAHALATRLSFFLTHSIPDEELIAKANDGTIVQEDVLRKQVERLLSSEASDEFVSDFLWSWLKLQQTRKMAPGFTDFPAYYVEGIADSMVDETNLFFRELIDKNKAISNLIDSDFAFVNSNLARHYGLEPPITFGELQKVSLTAQDRRGGLLGQASVLTASADGVETSPVTRGIWILENIMGTPPSPPPADVETALDPDLRGIDSVREQLAKHRESESCNECHKSIDPLGFSLENFDPTGSYRTDYKNGEAVDAIGYLPDGSQFESELGLKKHLLQDLTLVRRNLISKLLTYGTGRSMEAPDRAEIDRIADLVESNGDGVRDIIIEVVCSEIFRTK